ncbi:MAG: HAD family phosphatase [Clostridia bacterium]|nr:HAD family phosphatase [Clostridia bacterium]
MRDVRLIALDLDGTLLDSEKRLSEDNEKELRRASEAGIEIVPATGRFYRGMPENVRLLPYVRYVMTINGADVWDAKEKRTVCGSDIPLRRALEIMQYLDTLPVIYDCYMDGWGWMTKDMYDKAEEYAANEHSLRMIKTLRTPVPDLKTHLAETGHDVQKIQCFFKDMSVRKTELETLQTRFPDASVTTSIVNNVEFNSLQATKGNALRTLAGVLGIEPAQTMAFGDDLNDVSMLREAGIGVAMGNASDEVKQAADAVTDHCDRNGVAKAIRRIVWGEET